MKMSKKNGVFFSLFFLVAFDKSVALSGKFFNIVCSLKFVFKFGIEFGNEILGSWKVVNTSLGAFLNRQ